MKPLPTKRDSVDPERPSNTISVQQEASLHVEARVVPSLTTESEQSSEQHGADEVGTDTGTGSGGSADKAELQLQDMLVLVDC